MNKYIKDMMDEQQMIAPTDLSLYKLTNSVTDAVAEITGFYKVYHSMRYVKRDLVLRLQHALDASLLERIRQDFNDMLVSGTFEQTGALPEEANDTHLLDLPRLRFRFDRRS